MPRNSRVLLAYLIAALGTGLLAYGAAQWRNLPHYSDSDMAAAVELNLSLDLKRVGLEQEPTAEQLDGLRRNLRGEIEVQLAGQRDAARNWLMSGGVLLMMAFSQLLTQRYLSKSVPARRPR